MALIRGSVESLVCCGLVRRRIWPVRLHAEILSVSSDWLATLRRRTYSTNPKERISAVLLPQMAPVRPNFHVAGTPTNKDNAVADAKAKKTDSGEFMARNAIAGP